MVIHPLNRILLLLLLAVLVQFVTLKTLLPLLLGLLLLALLRDRWQTQKILRRSRWLVLTLLIVYAWSTPGEYLAGWPDGLAPTYEGLASGVTQALRLATMLAGLAWLLGATSREALMGGIYLLLQQLRWLGLAVERFTVRLWLTVEYVERDAPVRRSAPWRFAEEDAGAEDVGQVVVVLPNFGWLDGLLWLLIPAGLFWMLR